MQQQLFSYSTIVELFQLSSKSGSSVFCFQESE